MMKNIISSKGNSVRNNKVTISLAKAQLLHEIADYAYLEGDMIAADEVKRKQVTQDIVQGNSALRITRFMDMKIQDAINAMTPFADVVVDEEENRDNVPNHEPNYVVTLMVDSEFTKQKADRLAQLLHNFLVYSALAHWLGITNADAALKWKEESQDMLDRIGEMRFSKFVMKRPFYPFANS